MRQFILVTLTVIPILALAATSKKSLTVNYTVPTSCNFTNLPPLVNLSAQSGVASSYTANFNINCNSTADIELLLQSQNGSGSQARLKSLTAANFVNYSVTIAGINYTMGKAQIIQPNASSYLLNLNISAAVYTGTYSDKLTFTLNY